MDFFSNLSEGTLVTAGAGSLFNLLSLIFLTLMIKDIRKNIATKNWTESYGRMQKTDIEKHVSTRRENGSTKTRTTFSLVITYAYKVGTETYMIEKRERFWDRETAILASQDLNVGEKTKVFYDPKQPDQSQTKLIPPWGNLIWIHGFLFFFGAGCLLIYAGFFLQ